MARRKPKPLPPSVIYTDQPCKNNQAYVHPVDGSCLRCGADQGVACRDTRYEDGSNGDMLGHEPVRRARASLSNTSALLLSLKDNANG